MTVYKKIRMYHPDGRRVIIIQPINRQVMIDYWAPEMTGLRKLFSVMYSDKTFWEEIDIHLEQGYKTMSEIRHISEMGITV